MMRLSVSSDSRARRTCPVRAFGASKLIDPTSQAPRTRSTVSGESGGGPGITRLQTVQDAADVLASPRRIDFEMPQRGGHVRIGRFQQLEQPMFNFNVIVRPYETQGGSALQRATAGFVQLADQRLEIDMEHFLSLFVESGLGSGGK